MANKGMSSKRDKYTPRACNECQRRKVKCSGHRECSECRIRNVECLYTITAKVAEPRKPNKRPRVSLEESNFGGQLVSESNSNSALDDDGDDNTLRNQLCRLQQDLTSLVSQYNAHPSTGSATASTSSLNTTLGKAVTVKKSLRYPFAGDNPKESSTPGHDDLVEDNDTSSPNRCTVDILGPAKPWSRSVAVSSQVKTLRLSVGLKAELSYRSVLNDTTRLSITLPEPAQLNRLIGGFFRDFECYFPCLNRQNTEKQMRASLKALGYSNRNKVILVGVYHYQIVAILCSMIACAEVCAYPPSSIDSHDGIVFYSQGKRLMEHFEHCRDEDVNDVLYHTTSALFLYTSQCLRPSQQHLLQAFQIAVNIGLNDQSKWKDQSSELAYHQNLWWILYYLDKRVTQKSGIPYFIRENEVAVKDFRESSIGSVTDAEAGVLQSLTTFSRLWTYIWDNFFAANAPKAGNWEEIELVDARILISQKHLPPHLLWQTDQIHRFFDQGESDFQIRRRLLVYLRYQCLRLSIRHEKVTPYENDCQRRRSGFEVSKSIVEAVGKYVSLCNEYHTMGFTLTLSLVESIFYIAAKQEDEGDCVSIDERQETLQQAGNLLRVLSRTIGAASTALEALECVLFPVQRVQSPKTIQPREERPASRGRATGLCPGQRNGSSSTAVKAVVQSQFESLVDIRTAGPLENNTRMQADDILLTPPQSFVSTNQKNHGTNVTTTNTNSNVASASDQAGFSFESPGGFTFDADAIDWGFLGQDFDPSQIFDHGDLA